MGDKAIASIFIAGMVTQFASAAIPIVDGSDSVSLSSSLIVVREQYFENVDISGLGMLDSAGPVDQFAPASPPMGSAATQRVQSLLVRVSESGEDQAGTISFSEGVSILGIVTDLEGSSNYIWGARPNQGSPHSQLASARDIFGVGMDYDSVGFWAYDVSGANPRSEDTFSLDRSSRTITFSALAPFANTCDDLRILITYPEVIGSEEYFDVELTSGAGLQVGAEENREGQLFEHILLTPEPATFSLLVLVGLVVVRPKPR